MKENPIRYDIASEYVDEGMIPVDAIEIKSPFTVALLVLLGVALLAGAWFGYQRFLKKRR